MQRSATDDLADRLLRGIGREPTEGQRRASDAIARLMHTDKPRPTLVLKGYAGTGKTTLVGALVKVLRRDKRVVVLLAPTGRAAKVLEAYAHAGAGTIHRRIYRVSDFDGIPSLQVTANREEDALFIVDEASMIGTGGAGNEPFGDRDLLGDLVGHVFSAPGCRLLLVGDPAQLPPVGGDRSPALETGILASRFLLTAGSIELTEVVRQQRKSGILKNATALRASLKDGSPEPRFVHVGDDVARINGVDLQEELETAYAREGAEEVCVITRSNKRAYQYGMQVRARILGFEEEVCAGDRLMLVRNDYFWAGRNGKPDLIANGEPVEVLRVRGIEERFGARFQWIEAAWWSGGQRREGEVLLLLDVLALDAPALPFARRRAINDAILATIGGRDKRERIGKLKEDPFANALQVKYAYAVTCHKAQGGQWKSVFVDQGYLTEEMIDREYVRWLYTAVTRASERLYLVDFHPRFFGEE